MEGKMNSYDSEEFFIYSQKPTLEEFEEAYSIIIDRYKNLTDNERLIEDIFGNSFTESLYLNIKKVAEQFKKSIPSYEDICNEYNLEPNYDAKTAKEWQEEANDILILDISGGWESQEQFDNERISWVVYIKLRRKCECDCTKFADRIKKRNKISNRTIAGEAKKGQFIRFLSGSQSGKTGKVIDYLDDHNMMTVEVDGINKAICKTNLVDIIK